MLFRRHSYWCHMPLFPLSHVLFRSFVFFSFSYVYIGTYSDNHFSFLHSVFTNPLSTQCIHIRIQFFVVVCSVLFACTTHYDSFFLLCFGFDQLRCWIKYICVSSFEDITFCFKNIFLKCGISAHVRKGKKSEIEMKWTEIRQRWVVFVVYDVFTYFVCLFLSLSLLSLTVSVHWQISIKCNGDFKTLTKRTHRIALCQKEKWINRINILMCVRDAVSSNWDLK